VPHSAAPLNIVFVLTQSRATAVFPLIGINPEIYGWVIIESLLARMRFQRDTSLPSPSSMNGLTHGDSPRGFFLRPAAAF
jgi:hypothetical protein